MAESWKNLKTSNVFSSFIVCKNRNRSAPVCKLLSNNSLFVGQLYEYKTLALRARYLIFFATDLHIICLKCQMYEDKSLVLRARDLIFFTTDLQTVNYHSTIHC